MKSILSAVFLLIMAAPALAQTEKLGVGDAVRVTVFQQPDLTTEARINEKGLIAMPLVGEVKVAGLSQHEAAVAISDSLKKGQYLKNPQVAVAVTTVRSKQVSVLGLVARPGRYPLDDTSTNLSDVIAAAGGISAGGAESVTVLRDGKERKVDVFKPFKIQGGDTVNVERAPVFYIYGEVTRGGSYPITPDMTVMQAIAAGGGITPRGSDRRLKLRRPTGDGKLVETDAKLNDRVKADDVIFVKEALF
ncbi:MAG TPA: polysaccharide biosynthesis/export family protein [Burkholderiales bacterium]|nr:polysaccharide biosynthesis/export family protein [Burkholderiales bacterium]